METRGSTNENRKGLKERIGESSFLENTLHAVLYLRSKRKRDEIIRSIETRVAADSFGGSVWDGVRGKIYLRNLRKSLERENGSFLDLQQEQVARRVLRQVLNNFDKLDNGSRSSTVLLEAEKIVSSVLVEDTSNDLLRVGGNSTSFDTLNIYNDLFQKSLEKLGEVDALQTDSKPTGELVQRFYKQGVEFLMHPNLDARFSDISVGTAQQILGVVKQQIDAMSASNNQVAGKLLADSYERAGQAYFKPQTGGELSTAQLDTALDILEYTKSRLDTIRLGVEPRNRDKVLDLGFNLGLDNYFNGVRPENRTGTQKAKARDLYLDVESKMDTFSDATFERDQLLQRGFRVGLDTFFYIGRTGLPNETQAREAIALTNRMENRFDEMGVNVGRDSLVTAGFQKGLDVVLHTLPGARLNKEQQELAIGLVGRMDGRLESLGQNLSRDQLVDMGLKKGVTSYFLGAETGILEEKQQIVAMDIVDSILSRFEERLKPGVVTTTNEHRDRLLEFSYDKSIEAFFTNIRSGQMDSFKQRAVETLLEKMTNRLDVISDSDTTFDSLVKKGYRLALDTYFAGTTSETLTGTQQEICRRILYKLGRKLDKIKEGEHETERDKFFKEMYKKTLAIYFKPPLLTVIPDKKTLRKNAVQTRFYNPEKRKEFQDLLGEIEQNKGVDTRRFIETEDVFVEYFGSYGREMRESEDDVRRLYEELKRALDSKTEIKVRRRVEEGELNFDVVLENLMAREGVEIAHRNTQGKSKKGSAVDTPRAPVDFHMFDQEKKRKIDTRDTLHFIGLLDTSLSMSGDRIKNGRKSAMILSEAFRRIGITFSVVLFDQRDRVDIFKYGGEDYDPYDPNIDSWSNIEGDLGTHTYIGTAMQKAVDLAEEVGKPINIYIPVTDADFRSGVSAAEKAMVQAMVTKINKRDLKDTKKRGRDIAVDIGGSNQAKDYFSESLPVDDMSTLSGQLGQIVCNAIRRFG